MTTAYTELMESLHAGETVEAIVFGEWGWGDGYCEPKPPPIPTDKQGVLLTLEEAKPLMQEWQFDTGFGSPDCYPVYIWTSARVFWAAEYDGSTRLVSIPRAPEAIMPGMSGSSG